MANKSHIVAVRLDPAVLDSLWDFVENGGAASMSDYLRRLIDDDAEQREHLAEMVRAAAQEAPAEGMGATAHIEVRDDLVHVIPAGG